MEITHYVTFLSSLQSKKPKPATSMHPSSKKLDTGSLVKKKSSFSAGLGKKLTKKSQAHKRKKSTKVSVSDENVTTTNTTAIAASTDAHSFVSQLDVENSIASKSSHSAIEKNAEHKRALVEMKRLEKKQLEEQRLLKEKENLQLQEFLKKQKQEQLQYQQKADACGDVVCYLDTPKIKYPYVTPAQVSGLAELERRRVSEKGLELSAAAEILYESTIHRDREVDEVLQKAKEAEANFLAKLKEHERLQRIKKVSVKCYINVLSACILTNSVKCAKQEIKIDSAYAVYFCVGS